MKKSLVARGFTGIVASLLGVAAVGCSADVSDPQSAENEIGSTEQAITGSGVYGAMSCILEDKHAGNNDKYLVVAGGIDLSGTPVASNAIRAIKLATGQSWSTLGVTLGSARAFGKGIARTPEECVFVGGTTKDYALANAAADRRMDVLTVDNGTFAVTSTANALNAARSHFDLQKCGNGLIAVGGVDNGTSRNSVEVYDGSWHSVTATLSASRLDLSVAPKDSNFLDFVAVAGEDSASGPVANIDVIHVNDANSNGFCDASEVTINRLNDGAGHNVDLNTVRTQLAAFPKPSTLGSFLVAGGDDGTALSTTVPTIAVSNFSTGVGTVTASGNATSYTAVGRPALVYLGSLSSPALVSGFSTINKNAATTIMQTFASGSWTSSTPALPASPSGRVKHIAEYDPAISNVFGGSQDVVATTGETFSAGVASLPTADNVF
jgi:hypothetical protein